jgi:glycosyltransferase involved in cell wall biosynthesis
VKNLLNILFFAQLPPPFHGASMRNESLFESKKIRKKVNFIYVSFNYSKTLKDLGLFSFKKVRIFLSTFFKVLKVIYSRKIDLVYFTYSFRRYGVLRDSIFVALFRIFKIPILFHFRNKGAFELSKLSIYDELIGFSLKKGYYICISKTAVKDVQEKIDLKKLFIVNNGITKHDNLVMTPKNFRGEIKLLYVANFRKEKGIFNILDIFKILSTKIIGKKTILTIVGGEGDVSNDDIKKYIFKNNLKNVSIEGPLFGENKYEKYIESHIFVYPTLNDVFPGVILEALQFGLPVIANDIGSIKDIVKNGVNGAICDSQDINSFVDKLLILINNPNLCYEISKQNIEDFDKKYDQSIFEDNMLDVFNSVSRELI